MSNKKGGSKISVDFDIGINSIIPSTQEAFKDDGFSQAIRKEEKTRVTSTLTKKVREIA